MITMITPKIEFLFLFLLFVFAACGTDRNAGLYLVSCVFSPDPNDTVSLFNSTHFAHSGAFYRLPRADVVVLPSIIVAICWYPDGIPDRFADIFRRDA